MAKKSGWGFTKKPTPQRDKPKLHYFHQGRSLCHGTAPVEIRDGYTHPEKSPHACATCVAKKRALDRKSRPRDRQITTVDFVGQHQDFTSWDLDEKGTVIACRPFQGWVWCHRRVLNFDKLRVGEHVVISPLKGKRGKPSTIIHPIERITTQLVKEAA